jgi:chromosome segregation ATPase
MRKLKRIKLEEIIIEQNSKIKKINDSNNALKSKNKALKTLLERPGWDAQWVDTNLRRVERELKSLRNLVDQRSKEHQDIIDEIEKIENSGKENII